MGGWGWLEAIVKSRVKNNGKSVGSSNDLNR
jgi:hypothetical protein